MMYAGKLKRIKEDIDEESTLVGFVRIAAYQYVTGIV
jgi:hypothetical protein